MRTNLPALEHQISQVAHLPVSWAQAGHGQPIVFLHGWGGEIASFGAIPSLLADHFRSVAVDLPGFGKSPVPPEPWGSFEYADLVASFLRQQKLGPCTLVGHSFGGRVSIALAAMYPALVKKLVLVDSAGLVPRRTARYYARIYLVKTARKLVSVPILGGLKDPVLRKVYRVVGSADYNAAVNPILRATLVKSVNEDLRECLPRISVPTLLVWGDQDLDTPLSDGRLMEKLIPDAGLVVFEGAGHFAYLDRMDQFCRVVAHFADHE